MFVSVFFRVPSQNPESATIVLSSDEFARIKRNASVRSKSADERLREIQREVCFVLFAGGL